jgi:hypothetical protein
MKKILKKISIGLLAISLLAACNGKKNNINSAVKFEIKSPLPQADVKFEEFDLDNSKEQVIKTKRGSTITIPAGSLVDKDGKPAGNVKLKYREFHDVADILVSGIPMNFDSNGKQKNMQTAGMFEIRALKDGENLNIAQGKNIDVRMASYESGTDYNFFQLDEKGKGWQFIDYNRRVEVNANKEKLKKEIDKKAPAMAFPLDDKYFAFNYSAILDVMFNDNYDLIRKNRNNPAIMQKAKKYGLMWLGTHCHADVNFKGVFQPAALMVWKRLNGDQFPAWMKDDSYDFCSLTPLGGNIYALSVEDNDGKRVYKATIECVMPLSSLFKYSPEYWEKNYKDAMAKLDQEMAQLKLEADVYRSFSIRQLGIYNYDKLMDEEENVKIIANFTSDEGLKKSEPNNSPNVVYYVADEKTIIHLPKENWGKLNLVPGNKGRFAAILPNKTLSIYSSEKYAEIDFEGLRKRDNPKVDFVLTSTDQKISSPDDVRKLLGF